MPDFHPFSAAAAGLISMDNPEYILNEQQQQQQQLQQQRGSGRGNYHTLGIPLVNNGGSGSNNNSSPGSSQGPSSLHSVNNANSVGLPQPPPLQPVFLAAPPPGRNAAAAGSATAGLNGAMVKPVGPGPVPRTPGAGSHPRSSSAEESDEHEYYNDFDRLKREMQPLRPNPNRTTATQPSAIPRPPSSQPGQQQQQVKPLSPPPGAFPPGLQPISKHETTV